jgi:hypothetical protein
MMTCGILSEQGYSAFVKFGAANAAHLRLTEEQFATLTEHLPRLIEALCADYFYNTGVYEFLDNYRRLIQDRLNASRSRQT